MNSCRIVQAGMGVGVSNWLLAKVVSAAGQIGVVSGSGLDTVLIRRLQDGDANGDVRRALATYPDQEYSDEVIKKYFVKNGRSPGVPYLNISMQTAKMRPEREKLIVLANYVEVFLAKEGHQGKVGINFLEKIQLPVLPSLYGALLAGVDYVFMGAGIPREVPGVLDKLALHRDAEYKLAVAGASATDNFKLSFSPSTVLNASTRNIFRPAFYGIISSSVLAATLVKKTSPPVDGFVVEAPSAGGHNAPPRGQPIYNARGEPVYGQRDEVDLKVIADFGLPFWLAGSMGSNEALNEAMAKGAKGIQVGTAFALCDESGLDRRLKNEIIDLALSGRLDVLTDPLASPTGFPFKIARVPGTNSEQSLYEARARRCDLGYLREPYMKENRTIGYRCSSEPISQYAEKGGELKQTDSRKCLCNGLMANIGLPQIASGVEERPLVTLGDDVKNISRFIIGGARTFSARNVISTLLGESLRAV